MKTCCALKIAGTFFLSHEYAMSFSVKLDCFLNNQDFKRLSLFGGPENTENGLGIEV